MSVRAERLVRRVRACTLCRDAPLYGPPLPQPARPVLQFGEQARIVLVGQAPGARVHASGRPYTDASGVRLRAWLGISDEVFYDPARIAIVPMGFCFPGYDGQGGDLPPRRECAETWHDGVLSLLKRVELLVLIGGYAQRWHLPRSQTRDGVGGTVQQWREIYAARPTPRQLPLPHPSWRNTGWLKQRPWFESELLPVLRADVQRLLR